MLTVAAVVAVASVPLLRPMLPGNSAIPDGMLAVFVLLILFWARTRGLVLRAPFAIPIGLMIVAAALAGIFVDYLPGEDPGMLNIAKDVMAFLWTYAIVNHARTVRLLTVVMKTWVYTAITVCGLMIVGGLGGIDFIAGRYEDEGERLGGLLGDANYASNYYVISIFVMLAAGLPRRRGLRWAFVGVFLAGIVLTGSNGALFGLAIGAALGFLFYNWRNGRAALGVSAMALAVVAVLFLTIVVDYQSIIRDVSRGNPMLEDSIGRLASSGDNSSTSSRAKIFEENMRLWFEYGNWLGHGGRRTQTEMERHNFEYPKEAHNDYVAALTERGILGAIALLALLVLLIARVRRIAVPAKLKPGFLAAVPRPEMIAAALAAIMVSGLFYEIMHYRHVWAFFGILAAMDVWGRKTEDVS